MRLPARYSIISVCCLTAGLFYLVWLQNTHADAACRANTLVRVQIEHHEFQIPADLQPSLSPPNVLIKNFYIGGRLTKHYCQNPTSPPVKIEGFWLDVSALSHFSDQNPSFSFLNEIRVFEVYGATSPSLGRPIDGNMTDGSLFRRIDHVDSFELVSTEPLFFGGFAHAYCSPMTILGIGNRCTVRARGANRLGIRVTLLDRTHPLDTWPILFANLEKFLAKLQNIQTTLSE